MFRSNSDNFFLYRSTQEHLHQNHQCWLHSPALWPWTWQLQGRQRSLGSLMMPILTLRCFLQPALCQWKAQQRHRQQLLFPVESPQMAVFLQPRAALLQPQALLPPRQVRTCRTPANVTCSGFFKPWQCGKIGDNYGTLEKILRHLCQHMLDPSNSWGLEWDLSIINLCVTIACEDSWELMGIS